MLEIRISVNIPKAFSGHSKMFQLTEKGCPSCDLNLRLANKTSEQEDSNYVQVAFHSEDKILQLPSTINYIFGNYYHDVFMLEDRKLLPPFQRTKDLNEFTWCMMYMCCS